MGLFMGTHWNMDGEVPMYSVGISAQVDRIHILDRANPTLPR